MPRQVLHPPSGPTRLLKRGRVFFCLGDPSTRWVEKTSVGLNRQGLNPFRSDCWLLKEQDYQCNLDRPRGGRVQQDFSLVRIPSKQGATKTPAVGTTPIARDQFRRRLQSAVEIALNGLKSHQGWLLAMV